MNVQMHLIQRAMKATGLGSYSDLASRMGVTRQTVSQWKSGDVRLSDDRIVELAKMAGDDPGVWKIAVMGEETKLVSLQRSIQQILRQVAPTLALCAVLLVPGAVIGKGQVIQKVSGPDSGRMYIM